ncbi:hypothetical protein LTR97_008034 [Elasticomyces elasticus]|uniref:F-box domain-containing protein n=1 Tax=Elasticomyces elasticus TaxID=574655 RepID=A0AAN7VQL7_9PEZI|nr:hypothetical protein LTR97_008034 [Elasticomyces elasticus]
MTSAFKLVGEYIELAVDGEIVYIKAVNKPESRIKKKPGQVTLSKSTEESEDDLPRKKLVKPIQNSIDLTEESEDDLPRKKLVKPSTNLTQEPGQVTLSESVQESDDDIPLKKVVKPNTNLTQEPGQVTLSESSQESDEENDEDLALTKQTQVTLPGSVRGRPVSESEVVPVVSLLESVEESEDDLQLYEEIVEGRDDDEVVDGSSEDDFQLNETAEDNIDDFQYEVAVVETTFFTKDGDDDVPLKKKQTQVTLSGSTKDSDDVIDLTQDSDEDPFESAKVMLSVSTLDSLLTSIQDKAFRLPEIMEKILRQVPLKTLIKAESVNKTWHEIIHTTQTLKQKAFRYPTKTFEEAMELSKGDDPRDLQVALPVIPFDHTGKIVDFYKPSLMNHLLFHAHSNGLPMAYASPESLKMQLVQPPRVLALKVVIDLDRMTPRGLIVHQLGGESTAKFHSRVFAEFGLDQWRGSLLKIHGFSLTAASYKGLVKEFSLRSARYKEKVKAGTTGPELFDYYKDSLNMGGEWAASGVKPIPRLYCVDRCGRCEYCKEQNALARKKESKGFSGDIWPIEARQS